MMKRYYFKLVLTAIILGNHSLPVWSQDVGGSGTVLFTPGTTISCKKATIGISPNPEQNQDALKCTFEEKWAYNYQADMLDIVEDTAMFAKRGIIKACREKGMEYGKRANKKGTGGISNFKIDHQDRKGSVYARMTGEFFCVPTS